MWLGAQVVLLQRAIDGAPLKESSTTVGGGNFRDSVAVLGLIG